MLKKPHNMIKPFSFPKAMFSFHLPLNFGGLKHEDRPPQIPSRLFSQAHGQVIGQGCTVLLLDNLVQHLADLVRGGGTDPDQQTTTLDRANDFGGGVAAHDDAQVAHVLFHRAAQAGLGVSGQQIRLVDHHDCKRVGFRWYMSE